MIWLIWVDMSVGENGLCDKVASVYVDLFEKELRTQSVSSIFRFKVQSFSSSLNAVPIEHIHLLLESNI